MRSTDLDPTETAQLVQLRVEFSPARARVIRAEVGASLREAGAIVGVNASTVHRWEWGMTAPTGPAGLDYLRLVQRWRRRLIGGGVAA